MRAGYDQQPADPAWFDICLATEDGRVCELGDSRQASNERFLITAGAVRQVSRELAALK